MLLKTFAVSLAATLAVALLARLSGAKPHWGRMLAIAIGITVGQAIQVKWSLSATTYPLALGVTVAACVLIAGLAGRNGEGRAPWRREGP